MTQRKQPKIPHFKRELDNPLSALIAYLESAIKLDGTLPYCPCCGETENLTKGPSATGSWLYLCPAAAREALSAKE